MKSNSSSLAVKVLAAPRKKFVVVFGVLGLTLLFLSGTAFGAVSLDETFDTDSTNPPVDYPQYQWDYIFDGTCQVANQRLIFTGNSNTPTFQLFYENTLQADSTISADMTYDNGHAVVLDIRGGNSYYYSGFYYSGNSVFLYLQGPAGSTPTLGTYDTGFSRPADSNLLEHLEMEGDGLGNFVVTLTDANNPTQTFSRTFSNPLIRIPTTIGLVYWGYASGQTATFDNWKVIPGTRGAPDLPSGPVFGPSYDEFVGPFPSWINVKNAPYNAVGDGVANDTAALQAALNDAGATAKSVVYLPAGTYNISQTLKLWNKMHIGLIGQDPTNTTVRWVGANGGGTNAMLWADGLLWSRFSRITWDGAGLNVIGIAHKYTATGDAFGSSGHLHSDLVFQDMAVGLEIGSSLPPFIGSSDDTMSIVRCRFYRCSQAGVRTGSFNAFQNAAWDCVFVDNAAGIDDCGTYGGGGCFVYRCYFQNSSLADIHSMFNFWRTLYGNTSVGSKMFYLNDGGAQAGISTLFQDNKILDSQEDTTIEFHELGLATLIDNQIRSLSGTVGPVVYMGGPDGPDLCSINNRYTGGPSPVFVHGASNDRWWTQDDQVVDRSAISNSVIPALPGTPVNTGRTIYDLATNATGTEIQTAINGAVQHSVVHIPAGSHSITQTITIPANLDIMLTGDCRATKLIWTGAGTGPILRLEGPSKATITDINFAGRADYNQTGANAIFIDNPDQVGAKIYIEGGTWIEIVQYGLFVNNCANAVVEGRNFAVGAVPWDPFVSDSFRAVKVNGSEGTGTGYTALFNANLVPRSTNGTTCEVTSGGRLLMRDLDQETAKGGWLVKLTGSNTFTIADGRNYVLPGGGIAPEIELNGFTGKATFLNFIVELRDSINRQILVTNETSGTYALFLGMEGALPDGYINYFNRTGSGGAVSFLNGKYQSSSSGGSRQVPDQGDPRTDSFINSMLEQLRTEKPTCPATLPAGVTDVRLINVEISGLTPIAVQVDGSVRVNLTSPTNGAVYYSPATVSLVAVATDSDGAITNVEFYQNGSLLYTDTTSPYSYDWTGVPAGSYTLTAKAHDNGGASATSPPVNIQVIPPPANCYWDAGAGADQNWSTVANWSGDTEPRTIDTAIIGSATLTSATGIVSQAGEVCSNLYLGYNANTRGTLLVTGGNLTVTPGSGRILYVGLYGTGAVYQSAGIVQASYLQLGGSSNASGRYYQSGGTNTVGTYLFLGINAGAFGAYELSAGRLEGNQEFIGYSGGGAFNQSGGTHTYTYLNVGYSGSVTGSYELSGGLLQSTNSGQWIGKAGLGGIFTQTGGTNDTKTYEEIGAASGIRGTYNLYGGLMQARNVLAVGRNGGIGTLNLGNATNSSGVISGNLVIRYDNASVGTLRGWGTGIPSIKNNDQVMADGYGTDRTLDLSAATLNAKNGAFTYTSTNGWFAQNHGALRLPNIAFSGSNSACWGDITADQKLVNSVKFQYTGGAGALSGSLLATNHASVAAGLSKPIAVWDFSNATYSACTVTIRYNDLAAQALGAPENNLKVYQRVSGVWSNITSGIDTNANTITANAVSPISQIAVAE